MTRQCPICYDGVENPAIIIPCGHDACAACLTSIRDKAVQDNIADGHEGGAHIKCPTCRGKLDPEKLIDYNTFKKVHDPDAVDGDEAGSEISVDSDDETESDEDDDVVSNGDLRDFIVPDDLIDAEGDVSDDDPDEGDDEEEFEPKSRAGKASLSYNGL